MGGDANVAREEAAARGLTESPPPPGYARIPFPGVRLTRAPLTRRARAQNGYVKSRIGQAGVRWFRRLRPGSRLRRLGYRHGVTLTLKSLLAGDRDGLAAFYESDAEIVVPQWPGLLERYTGPDGFMDFFEAWTENWDQVELEITEVIDRGDVSVVFGWMHTRGGASGVATRQAYSAIFDYNASKITRGEWFLSWEEGMEAGGLEGEPLPG
jgi:ketosteroid isomerase-like protein